MLIYIFLILIIAILCFLSFLKKLNKKVVNISYYILFIVIFLLSAMRNRGVGVDTNSYCNYYEKIDSYSSIFNTGFEVGFAILVKTLHCFSKNSQLLIIVSSTLTIFSMMYFIKTNSSNWLLSLLIFILYNCWFCYLNIMRQAIAISFILLGYNNLKKNKFKNDLYFLLVVLFACAFHKAAIIAILLPFIRKFKITKNRLVLTGITGLLLFLIAGPLFKLLVILLPKYNVYSNSLYAQSNYFGVLLKLLLSSCILCFSFYYFSDNQFKFIKVSHVQNNHLISNPELNLQFNCYNMYNLILYLSLSMVVFERLSFYFMIFAVVLIPNIFGRIRNKTKQQLIIVFSIFLIYFLSISIIRPNWDGCIPYKFF